MRIFKSIFLIINYKTFLVTLMAVIATWVCKYYEVYADFPLTLIGVALVFPVVFSIDSAYKRRENALAQLGDFKNHLMSLYLASKDWITPEQKGFQQELRTEIISTYGALRNLFTNKERDVVVLENELFEKVARLSTLCQDFRKYGLQVGEMSRVSQYISKISGSIESMKVVLHYRTPVTLRAYSTVFMYSFPLLYAPYFAYTSQEYHYGLEYMMPVLYSFVLISLDNIQNHLENPFDQIGEDDIKFDVELFAQRLK